MSERGRARLRGIEAKTCFSGSPRRRVRLGARRVQSDQAVAHPLHAAVEMFDDGTGEAVEKGAIFGMIGVGSQVDVVLPWREGMNMRVRPGDRVHAGETLLCD